MLLGLLILALAVLRVLWRSLPRCRRGRRRYGKVERTLEALAREGAAPAAVPHPDHRAAALTGQDDWLALHIGAHIAFYVVVGLHIALVLKHTVIQRDRHLARCLSRGR